MSRVVVVAVVLAVSSALAAPDARARRRAGELAAEAGQHYKRGEFEVAATLLRKAYTLYPEPNLLYNLARSLEGIADKQGAIEAYEQYLASAKRIDDRGAIERRIATLKSELATAPSTTEPQRAVSPDPAVAKLPLIEPFDSALPPDPPPEAHDEPASRSQVPWLVIGGGAGALAGGLVCGAIASDRHDQAARATVGLDAQRLQDSANNYALLANALFVLGGAAVVGGVVWELHERSAARTGPIARARIAPSGVALEVTW
jgi:tetratricopeptide (TPR) repeat protein